MNFDSDFARLEKTAKVLRWVCRILGVLALVALATAVTAWPGTRARAMAFHDVQIHLDLMNYFANLGVKTALYDQKMVLGFSFEQIHTLLRLLSLVPAVLAIAGLFRQRGRQLLGYGALWYVMISVPNAIESNHGYEVAIPAEFGVRPPEVLFALPRAGTGPFTNVQRLQLQKTGEKQIEAYYTRQPQARLVRAQAIRKELDGAMGDLTPSQAAAMHYTAAQVAYLEQDLPSTRHHLNLISPAAFHPTWDADFRLRRMREWVQVNGGGLSAAAYEPISGWPLSFVRLLSMIFALAGAVALATYAIAARLALTLSKRLIRLRRLEERLREGPPQARMTMVAGNFGKRAANFSKSLETEYSGQAVSLAPK